MVKAKSRAFKIEENLELDFPKSRVIFFKNLMYFLGRQIPKKSQSALTKFQEITEKAGKGRLSQTEFIQFMECGACLNDSSIIFPLNGIVQKYARNGRPIDQDYQAAFFTSFWGWHIRGCKDDSDAGLGLFYRRSNIAKLGFDFCYDDEIFIKMIQGIKKGKGLADIKWSKLLLDLMIDITSYTDLKTIKVQAAKNNTWGHVRENPDHYKLVYDVTAKRCGLRNRDSDGNYWAYLKDLRN